MAYLGKTPSQAVRSRYYFTASGSETSLSGADDNSNTLTFTDGNYVDVSLNGVALVAGTDYNTTTANTIGGLSALAANDVVEIIVYDTFSVFGGNVNADLNFKDNAKAVFGDADDLQIYHDGSKSVIHDNGTGRLLVKTNELDVTNGGGGKSLLKATEDGAVELYHDNTKRFETNSTGAKVSGELQVADNSVNYGQIEVYGSSGAYIDLKSPSSDDFDLRLITFGSVTEIRSDDLHIQSAARENYIDATANGAVNLYYDNVKKLETTADGVTITSTDDGAVDAPILTLFRDSASPADSDDIGQINFKGKNDAAQDVDYGLIIAEINDASDGTESGELQFVHIHGGSGVTPMQHKFGKVYINNGPLELSAGVNIDFQGATANSNETTLTVTDPTADRTITLPDATGQVVLSDGAIDTEASAEIGRAHIGAMGHSDFAGFSHIDQNGTGSYALLQHSGGGTHLNAASGTSINFNINNLNVMNMDDAGLYFYSGKVIIFEGSTDDTNETTLTVANPTADRTITLPDATGTVLLTDGDGSNLTGINTDLVSDTTPQLGGALDTNGNNISFGDDDIAQFGDANEFTIKHQSNGQTHLKETGSGSLFIDGNNLYLRNEAGESYFRGISDGSATLYHNNVQRLITTSSGVDITGDITADNLATPAGSSTKGSYQTLTRSTWTKITGFTTGEYDSDSAWDGSRFTVPSGEGGRYLITCNLHLDYSAAGNDGEQGIAAFYINGTRRQQFFRLSMANGGRHMGHLAGTGALIYNLSDGHFVEVYAYMQDDSASGTLQVRGSTNEGSRFGFMRIN